MKLKLITIPVQSVFVGHRYIQNSVPAWSSTPSIRYYTSLITQSHALMDADYYFAYLWSFRMAGEPRQPLSSLVDIPTVPVVSKPSITIDSHGGAVCDIGHLGSTKSQENNEVTQRLHLKSLRTRRSVE